MNNMNSMKKKKSGGQIPEKVSSLQFFQNIDGFRQNNSQGL